MFDLILSILADIFWLAWWFVTITLSGIAAVQIIHDRGPDDYTSKGEGNLAALGIIGAPIGWAVIVVFFFN